MKYRYMVPKRLIPEGRWLNCTVIIRLTGLKRWYNAADNIRYTYGNCAFGSTIRLWLFQPKFITHHKINPFVFILSHLIDNFFL